MSKDNQAIQLQDSEMVWVGNQWMPRAHLIAVYQELQDEFRKMAADASPEANVIFHAMGVFIRRMGEKHGVKL